MKKSISGICLALLVSTQVWAHDENGVQVETLAKSTTSWDGETLPEYPRGRPEVTILKITIPPKTQLPLHHHAVINAGILIKGKLTVVSEDKKTLHLKAGDSIVELVNKSHYGKNEGDEPAEIVVFYAGILDAAITIKETAQK